MAETVRAGFLRGFAQLARDVGVDPLRMLDAVGIPRMALTDPDLKISAAACRDLLEHCSRAAEDFGLRLSELRTPSVMRPVALISREQPTMREAIKSIAHYLALQTNAMVLKLEESADIGIAQADLIFSSPGAQRQVTELVLGQLIQVFRRNLGPNWRPLRASMIHSPPATLDSHRRIFRCEILFDQDFNGIVFHRTDLDQPNPTADPEMARQIERYIEALAAPAAATLPAQVRALIQDRLATGKCTPDFVARQLGIELRTFQRHLAGAGTSFGEIVQDVRKGLTSQYLDESDRPLAEVAELLGFSALSAFSRWHRTHYGRPPTARRDHAAGHAGNP